MGIGTTILKMRAPSVQISLIAQGFEHPPNGENDQVYSESLASGLPATSSFLRVVTLGRDENLLARVSGRRRGSQEGTEATNRSILDTSAADIEWPWLSSRCHTRLRPDGHTQFADAAIGQELLWRGQKGNMAPCPRWLVRCRLARFVGELSRASVWSWRREAECGGAKRSECSTLARSGDAKLQTEAGADAGCPLPLATSVTFVNRNGRRQRENGAGGQPVERSKGHAGRGGMEVSE